MAKLASKYVGPYEIVEKEGPNTYSLRDQEGDIEDLIHAEHLKPYFDEKQPEEKDTEKEPEAISANTRPPMEPEDMATSDPPNQIDQPPAGADPDQAGASDATQPRNRGRPRKNIRIVRKATVNVPSQTSPIPVACEPPKRPRGRPKGSRNRAIPYDPVSYSPRKTRANLNP